MKKSDIAQKAINNNIMVQRAIFESDIKANNILKFIYINNGVVAREVFTFSNDVEDRFYSKDVEYQLEMLKLLNLVIEKTLLKKKFIFLTNRAVQLIEDKEEPDMTSAILDYSKLSAFNDVKLGKLITKNKTLAKLTNNVFISEVEDINKQIILNNIIYVNDNVIATNSIGKVSETVPKRKTMDSKRNSTGKKLINTNIYKMQTTKYYIYIDRTMSEDKIETQVKDLLIFFYNNYGFYRDLEIYTNLMYSKTLIELQLYAKNLGMNLSSLTDIINIDEDDEAEVDIEDIIDDKEDEEEVQPIIEVEIEPEPKPQKEVPVIDAVKLQQEKELETKLSIAKKYINIVHKDLVDKGFAVNTGTIRKGIQTELEIKFPSNLNIPYVITLNKYVPLTTNYKEFYNVEDKYDDTDEAIKKKVVLTYKEALECMEKITTEKPNLLNRNKYKFKLKELE